MEAALANDVDCLLAGGGPAGLTAAIYAARFRLDVTVVDAGESRAAQIPCTRNYPGFPNGISGVDLLDRIRTQAAKYGAEIRSGRVLAVDRRMEAFAVQLADEVLTARAIILATGVSNHRPDMADALHAQALQRGFLRYCPICDGFEVTDQNVGVIGDGARALKEAEFLRSYTERVTIVAAAGEAGFAQAQRAALAAMGVRIVRGPARDFRIESGGLGLAVDDGRLVFDAVYPARGTTACSDLAAGLGAVLTDDGCVKVDAHQRTGVPGVYAAGDTVIGLDQISHAMGEAGVAATTLRNDLAGRRPFLR